jgi:hypothetical protein
MEYNKSLNWALVFDRNNEEYNVKFVDIQNVDNSTNNTIDINKLNYNAAFSINNELIIKKVREILNTNIDLYPNIYELIKEQNLIASYLDKYILQNNVISKSFVIRTLNWLLNSAVFLAERLNLQPQYHNITNLVGIQNIPRCSYKFCSFKENCTYNYDKNKNGCYSDHYVYNMLTADIKIIIDYILANYSKEDNMTYNKELLKCINTLNFVIKHMYDEYNSVCMTINVDEYDNYFVNNKITEKKFKPVNKSSNPNKNKMKPKKK